MINIRFRSVHCLLYLYRYAGNGIDYEKKNLMSKKKNIRNFNIRKNMTSYTQVVSLLIVITS